MTPLRHCSLSAATAPAGGRTLREGSSGSDLSQEVKVGVVTSRDRTTEAKAQGSRPQLVRARSYTAQASGSPTIASLPSVLTGGEDLVGLALTREQAVWAGEAVCSEICGRGE